LYDEILIKGLYQQLVIFFVPTNIFFVNIKIFLPQNVVIMIFIRINNFKNLITIFTLIKDIVVFELYECNTLFFLKLHEKILQSFFIQTNFLIWIEMIWIYQKFPNIFQFLFICFYLLIVNKKTTIWFFIWIENKKIFH